MGDSDWQNETAEAVVCVLNQAGIAVSPATVAANLDAFTERSPDESASEETLEGLETEGTVRQLDEPAEYYLLTDHGRDYVETEIDQTAFGFVD